MSEQQHDHPPEAELHAFLDRELDRSRQAALVAHLESCSLCAQRLERLKGLFTLIESAPEIALESDLSGAVLRALSYTGRRLPRLAALEAALAVVLLLLAIPWLTAAEWGIAVSQSLQGWIDSAASEIGRLIAALPAELDGLLKALLAATQHGLPPGLPPIPAAELWLLAGSAGLLWAVGNGLLLRSREERS